MLNTFVEKTDDNNQQLISKNPRNHWSCGKLYGNQMAEKNRPRAKRVSLLSFRCLTRSPLGVPTSGKRLGILIL